jgi:hypothetical protein
MLKMFGISQLMHFKYIVHIRIYMAVCIVPVGVSSKILPTTSFVLLSVPIPNSFKSFLNKIREMNPSKTYFQDLALLSHINQTDTTYKGVMPRWWALCRANQVTSCQSAWLLHMSHANQTGATHVQNRAAPPFLFLPHLFLSSFFYPHLAAAPLAI